MTRLSVNVNKLATLRNARGKNTPDVTALAEKILGYGAHGITVHPRPDGRHVRLSDVWSLHELLQTWRKRDPSLEYNIEGFPSDEFLKLMAQVKPQQCTLVPDPPESITSDAGWDLVKNEPRLREILDSLNASGVRSSLFVEPLRFDSAQEAALKRLRPDRIELYTEAFVDAFARGGDPEIYAQYARTAAAAHAAGLGVNAGHDLNQLNLSGLIEAVPQVEEVSIGHALVCEALEQGLETTIRNYLGILR